MGSKVVPLKLFSRIAKQINTSILSKRCRVSYSSLSITFVGPFFRQKGSPVNWVVFHVASGDSFYTGSVIAGVVCVGSKLTTSADRFTDDPDALLNDIITADCQVLMLELPSALFHSEYGQIPCFAAKRHNTHLVLRRRFLFVFVVGYNTLDTIPLSQARHSGWPTGCGVWFARHLILIPRNSSRTGKSRGWGIGSAECRVSGNVGIRLAVGL